jgi:hypothetical protein
VASLSLSNWCLFGYIYITTTKLERAREKKVTGKEFSSGDDDRCLEGPKEVTK